MSQKNKSKHHNSLISVVVTRNRICQLKKCVQSNLKSDILGLVVVDNGSTDGTVAWLESLTNPRITIVKNTSNLGGSAGFEIGLRKAVEELNAEWVVLMDDDALPLGETLDCFGQSLRNTNTIYCGAVFYPDGSICEMNCPCLNPFWSTGRFLRSLWSWCVGGSRPYHVGDDAFNQDPIEIDTGTFVGFFVHRDTVEVIGYPNRSMFIYSDDILYSLTQRKAGRPIIFDPSLTFEHDCKTLVSGSKMIFKPLWKTYFSHRNSLITLRYGSGGLFWLISPLVVLKWLLDFPNFKHPMLYLRLISVACLHGFKQNTNWSLSDVERFISCKPYRRNSRFKPIFPTTKRIIEDVNRNPTEPKSE